nr:unnamed protein product [Callosobruchus analis]
MSSRARKIVFMAMDLDGTDDSNTIIGGSTQDQQAIQQAECDRISEIFDIESMPVLLTLDQARGLPL